MTPLGRFILRVFLWLPLCFGVWYFATILIAVPLALVLDLLMVQVFPDLVRMVTRDGNDLLVVLRLEALPPDPYLNVMAPAVAHSIDPVKYGYGLPLYTALVFAAPGTEHEKLGHWMLGVSILFLTQVFGVSAEIIKDLVFSLETARQQLGSSALGREVIALAYQLGYLILPSLAPVGMWVVQFRRYLAELVQL